MKKISDSKADKNYSLENVIKTDTISRVSSTPNGLKKPIKQYTPASFKRRLFSRLIDYLILGLVTLVFIFIGIIIFTSSQEQAINQYAIEVCTQYTQDEIQNDNVCKDYFEENLRYFNYAIIAGYIVNISYFIILPATNFQSTLGKKILKVKIVDKDSLTKINLLQSITREIFWIFATIIILLNIIFDTTVLQSVDQITFILISISVIQIPFNKYKQAWHDKLASTLVVKDLTKNEATQTVNK